MSAFFSLIMVNTMGTVTPLFYRVGSFRFSHDNYVAKVSYDRFKTVADDLDRIIRSHAANVETYVRSRGSHQLPFFQSRENRANVRPQFSLEEFTKERWQNAADAEMFIKIPDAPGHFMLTLSVDRVFAPKRLIVPWAKSPRVARGR